MSKEGMSKQCARVLDYMREFGEITPIEAMRDLGVQRLASRITDLRKNGYAIKSKLVPGVNRFGEKTHYAQYRLEGEANADR